jgi:hypothetical protein
MSGADEKENITQLPIQEKTVAVALKHIFDQIKKIDEEEQQEIQKVHLSFIGRFK